MVPGYVIAIHITLLVCFVIATILAIVFSKYERVKQVYTAGLIVVILASGLFGYALWPFWNWHLFPYNQGEISTWHEMTLVTADGQMVGFDVRAFSPSLPTPLRRTIREYVLSDDPLRADGTSQFALDQSNLLKDKYYDTEYRVFRALKFPPHQYGRMWSADVQNIESDFEQIIVHQIDAKLSEDGRSFDSFNKTIVKVWP